ncbi:MAG: FkbM family methyltransferase [Bacteroidota bacterium]|nr:FkbM family methyltransferase [Bacteroidota bacterium]
MINQFISKLSLADQIIFFTGKFFNKIASWILSYKNFKLWQSHYNILEYKNINAEFDGKEIHYRKDGLNALARKSGSDCLVFNLVIIEEEYKTALDIFLLNKIQLNSFLDLGGNIGLVSLYVNNIFPGCKIIAIEPDKNNYEMMVKNFELNHLANATPLMAGVSKKDCFLAADGGLRDDKEWSFSFTETDDSAGIKAYSINSLLAKYALEEIDFIKMDVEGAEQAIFDSDADMSFLDKVKVLAIEIHDEFNTRDNIYKILKEKNFIVFNSNETTIAVRGNLFEKFSNQKSK